MQIQISGQHLDITDTIRDYVNEKMGKLSTLFDNITTIKIVLKVDNKIHQIAEGTVHLAQGVLHAIAEHKDLYAAIDLLENKLKAQIVKHKEMLKNE